MLLQGFAVETWVLVADYQVIATATAWDRSVSASSASSPTSWPPGIDPERSTIFQPLSGAGPQPAHAALPSLVTESEAPPQRPTVKAELEATEGRAQADPGPGSPDPPTSSSARPTSCPWARIKLPPRAGSPHRPAFDKRYGRATTP